MVRTEVRPHKSTAERNCRPASSTNVVTRSGRTRPGRERTFLAMDALLAGRVALVTGGARGLGLEMAAALGAAGASVCLVDVLDDVEAAAADLAGRAGVDAVGLRADVTSPESLARAFDVAQNRLGLPTVLLCAAGVALEADTLDLPLAAWQRVLDVNLNGTLLACQELARRCVAASRPATIVNISS